MKRITVSELETYTRCPMEYNLKYVIGVPSQKLPVQDIHAIPGNLLGEIVHASIHSKLSHPDVDLGQLIQGYCKARDIHPQAEELDEIWHLCNQALTFHTQKNWLKYQTEVPFVLQLQSRIINGTIDFMGLDTAGWHIVDYKTDRLASRSEVPERAKIYQLQMMVYAAAATRAQITPLVDITLLFLRPNETHVLAWNDSELDNVTRQMERIMANISATEFTPHENSPCHTCPYHHNKTCWKDHLRGKT